VIPGPWILLPFYKVDLYDDLKKNDSSNGESDGSSLSALPELKLISMRSSKQKIKSLVLAI